MVAVKPSPSARKPPAPAPRRRAARGPETSPPRRAPEPSQGTRRGRWRGPARLLNCFGGVGQSRFICTDWPGFRRDVALIYAPVLTSLRFSLFCCAAAQESQKSPQQPKPKKPRCSSCAHRVQGPAEAYKLAERSEIARKPKKGDLQKPSMALDRWRDKKKHTHKLILSPPCSPPRPGRRARPSPNPASPAPARTAAAPARR